MSTDKPKQLQITPMIQQYMEIKERYQDAILFYRMGDFYEMFFDDAVIASKILGIALTSRNSKDSENRIPLCGVPHHAVSSYLAKLVKAGHRVAICEQVEDPKISKGVVKREVVRVVTPGLVTEDQLLDEKNNLYVASLCRRDRLWGLSFVDISTGEFLLAEYAEADGAIDEITRMAPAELLTPEENADAEIQAVLQDLTALLPGLCRTERSPGSFHPATGRENLLEHFGVANLAGFGCETMSAAIAAAGGLLIYLRETQKTDLSHIEQLKPIELADILVMDDASRRNLELTQTIIGGRREGSLLAALDFSRTPMGARLLKRNMLFPLQDKERINHRLDTVDKLYRHQNLRESLRQVLGQVQDLERLNSRVVLGSANARDLLGLKNSLSQLPALQELAVSGSVLSADCAELDVLPDILQLLERGIRDDAPLSLRDGNLIKTGYDPELDELVSIVRDNKSHILALEAAERQRSGIGKLKIGFNRVFGYYLEVSRGQLQNVPDYFIRKQTLVNAERFITPELKEFENKVMGAQEKRLELEYRLFGEIRALVAAASPRMLKAAVFVARLDFFTCLAEAARRYKYVRPSVNDGDEIIITEGRHPVIERSLPPGRFVPNDIHLDQKHHEVLIITGPNMAGKSTVLRQTALIVLMAQMGSFVPAAKAEIGMVDRIFTRVGAMDDLRRAQSTFMVEMNETANILNNATEKSLVILDEIGRGTSTFDGLSIAWAVAEDLVNKNGKGVKTLFATHYHELIDLSRTSDRVKNFHIAVREWEDSIIFLHKIMEGGTSKSYGIQVAALAGVPQRVISRAQELMRNIEAGELTRQGEPRIAVSKQHKKSHPRQLRLFGGGDPVQQKLAAVEPDRLSPIEALNILYELKKLGSEE